MCGIVGIIGQTTKKEIKKLLKPAKHRGLVYDEPIIFKNGGMGTNRLPIVDHKNGKQPVSNKSKTIFAVMNGEIFNHNKLREKLIKKGYSFQTNSDTELIPALYEEFGTNLVNQIDSEMFTIIIYNKINDSWTIIRDPLGVKPLYFAKTDNKIIFSSEAKQLVSLTNIKHIEEFPAGTIYHQNKFSKYFKLKTRNELKNKDEIKKKLLTLIKKSVKKRVQTELPIGVFLSGGIDSSLIMELANKYHNNVTGIILGTPNSTDVEKAIRFCKEKKYKYKLVNPKINFEKELKKIIYYLESYEPHIVRHSFANNILSKTAKKLGLKIVLVGEGADELFAGYNEFSKLSSKNINKGCKKLLESMSKGNLMRVDKLAMRHTIEIRSPFFDKKIINLALKIKGNLKIKKNKHKITTKYILRETAKYLLPEYIFNRYKEPLSNGAGLNVGFNYKTRDGELAKLASNKITEEEFKKLSEENPEYKFTTKEEIYYFKIYSEFKFNKIKEKKYRLNVLVDLKQIEEKNNKIKLLVAEFDYLALYFPIYLAKKLNLYKKYNLEVDFIATGGDDKTFASLIENSAEIGLADPIFSLNIDQNKQRMIIGELVNRAALIMITFKPNIKIKTLKNMRFNQKTHYGTYQIFSTTNTISQFFIKKQLSSINHSKIKNALYKEEIDVSILLAEQAFDLEEKGARIIYDLKNEIKNFFMTGILISPTIEEKSREKIPSFLKAIRESLEYIYKNKSEAYQFFKKEFPNLEQPKKTFDYYLSVWNKDLKINKNDLKKNLTIWKKIHPQIFN